MTYETQCDKVDWANLKTEVTAKLEYLRIAWAASERDAPPQVHKRIVEDIYVPAIRLLAEFCACLEVAEENERQFSD
jgi:hypothetical protein